IASARARSPSWKGIGRNQLPLECLRAASDVGRRHLRIHRPDARRLHSVGCVLALVRDMARAAAADEDGMTEPHPPDVPTAQDLHRIRASCSHVRVPDEPAARGYRYVDVGGAAAPFYLLRLTAGDVSGAVTLTAPIELTSGEE